MVNPGALLRRQNMWPPTRGSALQKWHAGKDPSKSQRTFSGNSYQWRSKDECSRGLKLGALSRCIMGRSGPIEAGAMQTEALLELLKELSRLSLHR